MALLTTALLAASPPVDVSAYRGKVLVLNFWASWCEPCRKELPALERVTYSVHPRVDLGIEFNPKAEQASPLANVRVLHETKTRPAIMVGTSSDRIGTPEGQSFYATVGKDLRPQLHLPIAPYVGVAYGTFEDRARPIGGANVTLGSGFSSLLIFDGVHFHPTVSFHRGRHGVSVLLVRSRDIGVSYNIRF